MRDYSPPQNVPLAVPFRSDTVPAAAAVKNLRCEILVLLCLFPHDRPPINSLVIFFRRLFVGKDQTIAFKSVRAALFCTHEVRVQG